MLRNQIVWTALSRHPPHTTEYNKALTSVIGFDAEIKTRVTQPPTVIEWSYIPKHKDPSHLPTIVIEKGKMALLGFINLRLNEQEAYDFSEDFLRDRETHASPATVGDHMESTLPPPEKTTCPKRYSNRSYHWGD